MDLKVPITIADELFDEVIASKALLNLASGDISQVEYQNYNADDKGLPWEHEDYDFSCGMLSNNGKDVVHHPSEPNHRPIHSERHRAARD